MNNEACDLKFAAAQSHTRRAGEKQLVRHEVSQTE